MTRRLLILLAAAWFVSGMECIQPLPHNDGTPPNTTASPQVTLRTNMGDIVVELFPQQAQSAELFRQYFSAGFYNNTVFHEIRKSGQATTWIAGGKYKTSLVIKKARPVINDSTSGLTHRKGRVALYTPVGKSEVPPHFLINLVDNESLDSTGEPVDYTVIGRVVSGMDRVEAIGQVTTTSKAVSDGNLSALPVKPVTVNDPDFNGDDYTDPDDDAPEDDDGNPIDDGPDETQPVVTITSPTSSPTYTTTSGTIDLAGTASDDVGVVEVVWSSDVGGSGTCAGTTSWTASGIALQPGVNVITVTASDADGQTGSDRLTVTCNMEKAPVKLSGVVPYGPPFFVSYTPVALTLAPLDENDSLDVVTANPDTGNLTPLLNKGDGEFAQVDDPSKPFVLGRPIALIAGDFTNDRIVDLATANENGTFTVLPSEFPGTRTFVNLKEFPVGTGPAALVAGDFNGDGNLDVAVANAGSHNVSIKLGNGAGDFTDGGTASVAPASEYGLAPVGIAAADFDGDGDIDLATANRDTGSASILTNDGAGVFTATTTFPLGVKTSAIVAADFGGDGRIDLAFCNRDGRDVMIVGNKGGGEFEPKADVPVGAEPVALAAGKLDDDAVPDLVVANRGSDTVSVLIGKGDGTFESAVSFATGREPVAVAVGDLNKDGLDDVAIVSFFNQELEVMLNMTGQSGAAANSPPVAAAEPRQYAATGATVTLDGSGSQDPNGEPITYQWEQTSGTAVVLAGANQATTTFTAPATAGTLGFRLTVADSFGARSARPVEVVVLATPAKVGLSTSMGDIVLEVLLAEAPVASSNFLRYVADGYYNGTIFHRIVPDFVVQGGGYLPTLVRQPGVRAPIVNEFSPDRSNVRGTVAMAKRGDAPDSATCEFFFNLADNSANLDQQNGGFTVFARVIEGMGVVDAMAAVPTGMRDDPNGNVFEDVPATDIILTRAQIQP